MMLAQDLGSAVQGLHGEAAPPDTPTSASPIRSSLAPKARRPGTPLSACFPAALQGACVHAQGPSLQLLQHKHPCACSLQLARQLRELLSSRPSWILGTTTPPSQFSMSPGSGLSPLGFFLEENWRMHTAELVTASPQWTPPLLSPCLSLRARGWTTDVP